MYTKSLDIMIRIYGGDKHLDVAKTHENMAIIYQKLGKKDQAVVEFHKSLVLEIKVRGDNHPLPLLFDSMLQCRAENKSFNIFTKERWHAIRDQVREQTLVKEKSERKRKGDKQIGERNLKIGSLGGQAEALAGTHTAQDEALFDGDDKRYVHRGEVFGVLLAALEKFTEGNLNTKLKQEIKDNYCNITDVVIGDFLRALYVCYNLAGITAPAGILSFEHNVSKCHEVYMNSEYLQKVLASEKLRSTKGNLNEEAAQRFQNFLDRMQNFLDRNAGGSGSGKKRSRVEQVHHATTPSGTPPSIHVIVQDGNPERKSKGRKVDVTKAMQLWAMRELGVSFHNVRSMTLVMCATACATVVMLGTMDEGQFKDQPVQRRLLGISVQGQYLELDGSVNQKQLAFAGLLMCLVATVVLFLELRKRWQLNCKDPWKNLGTGRNCKDLEAALQTLAQKDLALLVEGIWFHLERPEVVAGALKAVLKIMAGPVAAKVFQVPVVEDDLADENARRAFRVGVLEVTRASMEKHKRDRDVQALACGVLWTINALPEADDIRTASRCFIPLLFGALESFGTPKLFDSVIVQAGVTAMGNLIYNDDNHKADVMAARVLLNNGKEASGFERVIELLSAGVKLDHAGIQESAVKMLFNLAKAAPPSRRFSSLNKNRLDIKKLGVDKIVQDAMYRPHATETLKKDGQKLRGQLERLRRRKKVPKTRLTQ